MRGALVALAGAAFTALAMAGPATAAQGQVSHFRFSGAVASAEWDTSSATSSTGTLIDVSRASQGSVLLVAQFTTEYDAGGNVTGYTTMSAEVASGFSFALRQPLASASLSASGLPARTCAYDASFKLIGCTATSIDATAAWTGQGTITRSVIDDHFKSDGLHEIDRINGTHRLAVASGTVGGLALTASKPASTDLGTIKTGGTTICIGNNC